MNGAIKDLGARIRNLFSTGVLSKRYTEGGRVQAETHTGRVLEKAEAFPYGFIAKAKSGRVLVFCQGGNYNDFEIFPVLKADDVTAPELEDGDAALYTGEGSRIVLREAGGVEITLKGKGKLKIIGEDGTFYLANGQNNLCKILTGLIDKIKAMQTMGSPPSHTVSPVSQQELEAYKAEVKKLFAEAP